MVSRKLRRLVRRPLGKAWLGFARDRRGTAAIEFGMIAIPFLGLMIAILTIGLQYYTTAVLDHGVSKSSRQIRTGQAQSSDVTVAGFKRMICDSTGSLIACDDRLQVHLKSGSRFSALSPPVSCLTQGNMTAGTGAPDDNMSVYTGGASQAVLVTACYEWTLGTAFWRNLHALFGMPTADKVVLSSTSVFRTEPYQ